MSCENGPCSCTAGLSRFYRVAAGDRAQTTSRAGDVVGRLIHSSRSVVNFAAKANADPFFILARLLDYVRPLNLKQVLTRYNETKQQGDDQTICSVNRLDQFITIDRLSSSGVQISRPKLPCPSGLTP